MKINSPPAPSLKKRGGVTHCFTVSSINDSPFSLKRRGLGGAAFFIALFEHPLITTILNKMFLF